VRRICTEMLTFIRSHRVCSRIKRSLRADRRVSTKLPHEMLNDDAVISTILMTQHTFTFHVPSTNGIIATGRLKIHKNSISGRVAYFIVIGPAN
jgi:hypothetical protein